MEESLFCKTCKNLLSRYSLADKFYFQCNRCLTITEPSEKDTLVYEKEKGSNIMSFRTLLLHVADDPVATKIAKKCPECGYTYARQIRIGDDMRLFNSCIKCKYKSLDYDIKNDTE